ncbi:exonuclease SbcCD subunit D [Clostridium sp. P21]|uniref:Nuclease SbcCD subunit D n=1 Tax=Clostridium muellerianum TaxID=2716538 RepID=A0A7Y0EFZ9_9CLOT|nr:exonuclease SbcCD subunit D [Clostridium muellerianum]NMM62706.1 exonuclease SbcCD subunit D [Clostridium muellerianum]
MKIIHTGDWHIGKMVHQIQMIEDQEYILKEFIKLIEEEKPDVVVIAGDLYDRSVPPVVAVELLDRVFTKILVDLNTPIIAIAGNHDSGDRVGFASQILKNKGLYICGKLRKNINPIVIKDQYGEVNFYPIPYADPAEVRHVMENEDIHNHNEAMKSIIGSIKENVNESKRNVLIAHGFVIGAGERDTCESERPLSIGGTEFIDIENFNGFNYTALGHLHGAQKVGGDKVRYSGSLLKYSFSEFKQKKSVTIVNLDKNGEVSIELKSLIPHKDMRIIKGKMEDLLSPDVYKDTDVNDYIYVDLTDECEIIEPMSKLRTVYPNVLKLTRNSFNRKMENGRTSLQEDYNNKTMLELFNEFYTNITGREFTEEKKEVLVKVLKSVEKKEGR